ncbi:alpha/beta hydrolase [Shewanella sp. KX20019]|uniref:alpha/beta hydrolase YcfP n=1 Tax=Shewanella sp. KX20019 TaxID=2803864 RepID=UPI0019256E68|nr:alpha/beta hydrolase YcfP [Shewanella sp. KX20019]QQX81938.1 alpha/beta hydrolase [Shewanella sp. KX20019]
MILYLHGFDATSPGNHDKMRQLQFIDEDVRLVSYSTQHPKNDMQYLLNEVSKHIIASEDVSPLIIGVGLGAFWAERIGFLNKIKSVLINPNLAPQHDMVNKIDRPEEYADIMNKCVTDFRLLNREKSLCILARNDEVNDNDAIANQLKDYYSIVWDEEQSHKFTSLAAQLNCIKAFKIS